MAENEILLNEKGIEILITKLVPTSQYFERSFEMLQNQLQESKERQIFFEKNVDKRFEQVDKRFEQVDKRFEQVDKTIKDFKNDVDKRFEQVNKKFEQIDRRFEQVDKRFEQVNDNISNLALKIEQLTKAQETTMRDYIIDRDRHYDSKFNNLRMFNIAIISAVAGVILKITGILHFS